MCLHMSGNVLQINKVWRMPYAEQTQQNYLMPDINTWEHKSQNQEVFSTQPPKLNPISQMCKAHHRLCSVSNVHHLHRSYACAFMVIELRC